MRNSRSLKGVVCVASILVIGTLSMTLVAAPPEVTGSKCQSSTCTNAIYLTEDNGSFVDGCQKDAAGVCVRSIDNGASVCYTCTGASSSSDLCFNSTVATDTCTAQGVGSWTYSPCGTKNKQRCAAGGSGPSGCCDTGTLLTNTTDACQGPLCSLGA